MSRILIRGASVLTMEDHDALIRDGEIGIESGKVAYVGPPGTVPENFNPDEVLSGADKVVMPGLVNCHTHAAMTLLRSYADDLPLMQWLNEKIWPLEAKLTADDIYWGTMLCCLEMIKSGTTAFAAMYDCMEDVARAVEQSGMRASLSRGMIGVGPNAAKALADSRALVQNWQGAANGRITTMLGPHAPYTCPPEYLQKVMALADELGVGIHMHLAETRDEWADMQKQYGKTPIQHVASLGLFNYPVLAAHCVHLDQRDIEILAGQARGVAHCPESNMKLASGVAPVTKLIQAGANVGLGTDGASSNNNLDLMEEMRAATLLQKVSTMDPLALPSFQTLQMATVNGARALGLGAEVGLIKVGMKADVIMLETRRPHLYPQHDLIANLVYAANSGDVSTVIIDGNIVMQDYRVLTIDEDEVLDQVQRRAAALVAPK